jgi:hypothetical protein
MAIHRDRRKTVGSAKERERQSNSQIHRFRRGVKELMKRKEESEENGKWRGKGKKIKDGT